jgi:hypothetical protein
MFTFITTHQDKATAQELAKHTDLAWAPLARIQANRVKTATQWQLVIDAARDVFEAAQEAAAATDAYYTRQLTHDRTLIDFNGWSDAQHMHSARNSFMAAKQVFNRVPTNSL